MDTVQEKHAFLFLIARPPARSSSPAQHSRSRGLAQPPLTSAESRPLTPRKAPPGGPSG